MFATLCRATFLVIISLEKQFSEKFDDYTSIKYNKNQNYCLGSYLATHSQYNSAAVHTPNPERFANGDSVLAIDVSNVRPSRIEETVAAVTRRPGIAKSLNHEATHKINSQIIQFMG